MDFNTLVNEVIAKVKRPDKASLARVQVNAAIQFFSQEHDYKRDLREFVWTPTPVASSTEFIIPLADLERFRKIAYIKLAGTRHYLEELEALKLTKDCEINDKWYIAGDSINAKSSLAASALDIGYYRLPPYLTDNTIPYWMISSNWMAILERASAMVFNDIGDTQSYQAALRASNEYYAIFKGDYIRGSSHG